MLNYLHWATWLSRRNKFPHAIIRIIVFPVDDVHLNLVAVDFMTNFM